MENNRRGTSSENDEVTASGDELAKNNDVVIEDPGEVASFHPSLKNVFGGSKRGNEKARLDIFNFLPEVDSLHPDYEEVLADIEVIVNQADAEELVCLVRENKIHSTVPLRLFEKYIEDKKYSEANFIKLDNVLTELGVLNYDLNKKLTSESPVRYYSVLKKAEMILKEKKPYYKEGTPDYIVEMVKQGKLSKLALDHLIKEFAIEFKDKTAIDIVAMVRKGDLHKSVLDSLAKEYIAGRAVPAGDMNEKIKEALNELEK